MKIVLIGYGKMGREIETAALARNHSVIAKIDIDNYDELNATLASEADVAIEFTTPSSVLKNIYKCFELNLPIVVGTTGWHNELDKIKRACNEGNHSLFYSSNFSVGVNLFFALNENLAEMMNNFKQYDVSMKEIHHTQKLDAPSGTAVTLADMIVARLERKSHWNLGEGKINEINIEAIREGDVKGTHSVKYESEIDTIEVTHSAKSRKGFAEGAVLAAEYLWNKKGIFTMRDLLGI
ncbi:MAG: 4-hydroxy-tetrahydrodipicolinate reductase [Bacteroidales bacterium]